MFIAGICFPALSQNLIVNPSAELDPTTNGWTQIGGSWVSGSQVGAQQGSYHFFAGVGGDTAELYQDIDVSADAAAIDAGGANFTFSGYMRVYFQFPQDQGRMIVEYRDGSGTVLDFYDSGLNGNMFSWDYYSDTRTAPAGTRTVRIRLISYRNKGADIDGYMDNLSLTKTISLPVVLSYFNTSYINDVVILNWITNSEQNNDYFTIERSNDGINWEEASTIDGAGDTEITSYYTAEDSPPYAGKVYYRLKQTDYDGTFTYSAIKVVIISADVYITIYPNPANGYFWISNLDPTTSEIAVLNQFGKSIPFSSTAYEKKIRIDTESFKPGVYLVQILTGTTTITKKVVIR